MNLSFVARMIKSSIYACGALIILTAMIPMVESGSAFAIGGQLGSIDQVEREAKIVASMQRMTRAFNPQWSVEAQVRFSQNLERDESPKNRSSWLSNEEGVPKVPSSDSPQKQTVSIAAVFSGVDAKKDLKPLIDLFEVGLGLDFAQGDKISTALQTSANLGRQGSSWIGLKSNAGLLAFASFLVLLFLSLFFFVYRKNDSLKNISAKKISAKNSAKGQEEILKTWAQWAHDHPKQAAQKLTDLLQ